MTPKIIDYTMATSVEFVRQFIDQGWQPFGSPMRSNDAYLQAMVKYEEPPLWRVDAQTGEIERHFARGKAEAEKEKP